MKSMVFPAFWFATALVPAMAPPADGAVRARNDGLATVSAEEPEWTTEPISADLGLLDLTVLSMPGADGGVELAFDEGGSAAATGRVDLREAAGEGGPVWRARLWRPAVAGKEGSITFWLRRIGGGGLVWLGPYRAATRTEDGPPAWALGAVWYQVFPERFANGNPRNDPRGPGVFRRAWNSAWEDVSPAEIEAAWARAEEEPRRYGLGTRRAGGALYGVATARRYGGDLEGVVARLDSLKDLGVTALYLNPIFDAPSMHKYDAADYRHVDPTLAGDDPAERPVGETLDPATWGWTDADRFLIERLLPEAHARGIRVILDGVWNHTSTEFWAFRDVAEKGPESPYAPWYTVRFARRRLDGWQGWNGWNGSLPQFARGADGNIVAPVRAHIADITRRWMDPDGDGDPSDGIDGWRLDVAKDIPTAFWREWCPLVRSINRGAVMIGEVWSVDRERVGGGLFDAQMNYPFAMAVVKWLDGRDGFGSEQLRGALEAAAVHSAPVNLSQMNLLDSHDTARVATMLNNPGRGYGGDENVQRGGHGYRTERPAPEVYQKVLLGVALQAMWPGSPMVYGGDEWGEYGADDPDDRKPVPWPDLGPYQDAGEGPDAAFRERCRAWLRLRADAEVGPILRYGGVEWVATGNPDVAAFVRRLNSEAVLVVLNRGEGEFVCGGLPDGYGREGAVGGRSAGWWRLRDRPRLGEKP